MFDQKIFGERLKALRLETKTSQTAIGNLLGVGKTQISEIENGHRATTIGNLVVLADYFGVTTDYLLGRSEKRN